MSDAKPCKCGCGGEVWAFMTLYPENRERPYICQCRQCFTRTGGFPTEKEAIEAWNTAMGNKSLSYNLESEILAKAIEHDASIIVNGFKYQQSEYLCGNCKKKVLGGDDYCSHCGAKLDWTDL